MSQQQHQGQQPIGRTSLRESTTLLQIDAVLSQNGLPYQEYAKPIIRSHLSSLLQVVPSLQVKLEPLSRKDGVPSPSQPFPLSLLLLQVCGTIPISFLQVLYNIPIVIWLPDWYPFCAPIVFVTPSPFMVIKAAHPLVDQSGQVSLIHLYPWTYPSSNLVELVNRLCAAFGKDPPLYSVGHPHRFNDGAVSVSAGLWPPSSSSSSPPTAITTSCLSASSFSATVSTSGSMSASSSEAVPIPELPSNANSLLGPGSMPQLHQYGAKAAVPQSALAGRSSASLLGPGSLSQRWPPHVHVTHQVSSSLPLASSSSSSSVSSISLADMGAVLPISHIPDARRLSANSSKPSTLGGALLNPLSVPVRTLSQSLSLPTLSSSSSSSSITGAVQQPHHVVHGHVDSSKSLSSVFSSTWTGAPLTPTFPANMGTATAYLIYPTGSAEPSIGHNKLFEHSTSGLERHKSLPQASSDLAGSIKTSSLSFQGQFRTPPSLAQNGSLPLLTPSPQSLLGPGNAHRLHPVHDRNTPDVSLPSSVTSLQPCLEHSSQTAAMSSSGSLLGPGPSPQLHSYKPQSLAESSSSLIVPGIRMHEHTATNIRNEGETNSDMLTSYHLSSDLPAFIPVSTSSSLLPMPYSVSLSSSFLQDSTNLPLEISNPLLYGNDQPLIRQKLMTALIERLHYDTKEIRISREKDMLKLMTTEAQLRQRQMLCRKMVEELQQQKENLELQLQNVLINTDFLETWLMANDKKNVDINVDDAFEPCDVFSHQLLQCTAKDLAIEDAFYCLDRAAQEASLPVETYLRLVRTLSREQFFHRAVGIKIQATQAQICI